MVDLLQGALCTLRCGADCSSVTLHKGSRRVHVIPGIKNIGVDVAFWIVWHLQCAQIWKMIYNWGPFSSTPPKRSATPNGRLCRGSRKEVQSYTTMSHVLEQMKSKETHHRTRVGVLLPKLQCQVGHCLGYALHRHGLIISEPVVLSRSAEWR